ncbi:MAG: hypothetical protein KIT34_14715 [Cyanobacteria bacterium TGS_CYA1]|nr:hypothetical protein [Cyanobacteria bacterium TGS_CYA1]
MKKLLLLNLTLCATGLSLFASSGDAAFAQGGFKIQKNKLDKVQYYHAPREMQILDERPFIKDFREAPSAPEMVPLPPGPKGAAGGYGGNGGGAAGDIPSGGGSAPMQMGGTGPAYRSGSPSSAGAMPLPKSGFGRETNIPAGGMAPKNALPDGTNTNRLAGRMMTPKQQSGPSGVGAAPARSMAASPAPKGPVAANYGSNYGAGDGYGSGGGGSRTDTMVRGSLLTKVKGK